MAEFAPPSGPPPPKVPEGWKAVWNSQYNEWFYVNVYTKKSQWDKPTEPVYGQSGDDAPPGPPPSYDHSKPQHTGPEKGGFASNNPYGGGADVSEDERLARQLQAEEEARARAGGSGTSSRGAADSYYQSGGNSGPSPYGQQSGPSPGQAQSTSSPPPGGQTGNKGFFSKLSNKFGGSSSPRPPQQYGGQQGYPPQQGGYGGGPGYYPPQQGGGYYPPQPQQQYYPQQQPQGYYGQQQPQRKHGGGLGAGGGALLGAGAGLIGGALLMDAIDDHQEEAYQEGYEDGGGGDDYGGDDFGGDF